MAQSESIPLILLAGGSGRYKVLPNGERATGEEGGEGGALAGYKAIDLKLGGRPVIEHGLRRFRSNPRFGPIYIAGPRALYEPLDLGDVRLIDTDGDFGTNLRNATQTVARLHPGSQVAYSTADVIPEPADLEAALEDHQRHQPTDFWMLECRVPDDPAELGASQWKPRYRIRGESDPEAVETLPGHLVIVDPSAVRLQLTYEIFDLAYESRNYSIPRRTWKVAFGLGSRFVRADVAEIRQGRRPTVIWDVFVHGLIFAFELWRGIPQGRMEDRLRRIFVHRQHRRAHPERRGRVALLDVLSLAKDVDTEDEAREMEQAFAEETAAEEIAADKATAAPVCP